MANPVVKVRRETIVACMTCPLCKKLFRDATTISECLHTFCRKCIYNKISDEELECCPICNTDLGCVPLEKLRSLASPPAGAPHEYTVLLEKRIKLYRINWGTCATLGKY